MMNHSSLPTACWLVVVSTIISVSHAFEFPSSGYNPFLADASYSTLDAVIQNDAVHGISDDYDLIEYQHAADSYVSKLKMWLATIIHVDEHTGIDLPYRVHKSIATAFLIALHFENYHLITLSMLVGLQTALVDSAGLSVVPLETGPPFSRFYQNIEKRGTFHLYTYGDKYKMWNPADERAVAGKTKRVE